MQWLAQICVRRPVFATVLVLTLVVVGIFGYFHLGVDRFPKVDFNIVTVTVREDGASPEEIETDVVDKIEQAVNTVSGIDQLTSTSYEGVGVVIVTFTLEKDINVAAQEVRDKVSIAVPDLPIDIKTPVVDKVDPDASPILEVALSSPGNIRDTTEYADKVLRRRLESINGVGQVLVLGGLKRQINVIVDPDRMRAYNLTSADVQRALEQQNIQVPGGQVEQGASELTLRTRGRIINPADFADIVVAKRGVTPVYVSDIGRVEDSTEEPKTVAEITDVGSKTTPTVLLSIRKQSGLNTVATVDLVKQRLADISTTLPRGYTLRISRDQSEYIRAATDAVKEHLILGSVLAALVVLVFLWNFRTTLISAIAIPASIISTFALMNAMNFTLNGLTLLALTLSVGIVIDDAIVVLENIYRFIEEKRVEPFKAAVEATREIGPAVMATTLSLIAVFLPVAFMQGIVGRFLNSFGITMAFAILVSLLVSFTLTPMLAARWIKRPAAEPGHEEHENVPVSVARDDAPAGVVPEADARGHSHSATSASKENPLFKALDAVYTVLLKFAMRRRWVIVLAAALAFFSMFPLPHTPWPGMIGLVPKSFLPDDDESQFQVTARAPEGTSISATQEIAESIARDVRKLPGVLYTVATIGNNTQQTPNVATIFVKLKPVSRRGGKTQQDIMVLARRAMSGRYNALRTSVSQVQAISTGAPAYQVIYYIAGPDLAKLTEYSQKAIALMRRVPGAADVDSSLVVGKPELGVDIDRKRAADLGVSVADIANALRILVGGDKVTDYYENGEQYEVHLRADLPFRNDKSVISRMTVPSSTLGSVSLDQVVTFGSGTGPAQITRQDRRRNVLLQCNVLPGYGQQEVANQIAKIVEDLHMPAGYQSGATGNSRELGKAFIAFVTAFLLAFVFMYLILAAQFESWVHPATILIALPLTLPFALMALALFHQTLNIFSVLGILVLFGVVKKNGILQVDHTNQLRARGMNRYDAIIAANRDRLRPILMTTFAFVAGMFPLVISSGTGAATNRTIGFAVIGGQTLSLLLTLLATPVFYSIFDDITEGWKRARGAVGGRFSRRAAAPTQPADAPAK
jgi:hydrophobic/amphiphilic exporter-1 (mainly G- bacteria), HAE1 family